MFSEDKTSLIKIEQTRAAHENIPSLIVVEGEQIGDLFKIKKGENIIGRGADVDIRLNSLLVSRVHSVIILNDNNISIKDLKSSNGTYVNGKKIDAANLKEGDVITIGTIRLSFMPVYDSDFIKRMIDDARIDQLTGLYNKGYITHLLDIAVNQALILNTYVSIAIIDIDHFKNINDTYGHIAGDTALRYISNLFRKHLRPIDNIGRFGGEEFLVILDKFNLSHAASVFERLRTIIASSTLTYEDLAINITVSIGVACNEFIEVKDTLSLIKIADQKLYRAKMQGRNRIAY